MGILNSTSRRERKFVGLATRSEALGIFLGALLEEWGHQISDTPSPPALLLAEEGCIAGKGWADVLRIGSTDNEERNTLVFPLSLERLWRTLEAYFFKPSRCHLRINLDLNVKLKVRNRAVTATLINLSDLGCRIHLPFELIKEEEMLLQLRLRNKTVLLQSKVSYVSSNHEANGSQIGLQFQRIAPEISQLLRDFIIIDYLSRVRKKIPGWVFSEGLTFFALSPGVLGALREDI